MSIYSSSMRRPAWGGYAVVGSLFALLLSQTASLTKDLEGQNGIQNHINNSDENSLANIIQYIKTLHSIHSNGQAVISNSSSEADYLVITSGDSLADGISNIITFIEKLEFVEQRAIAYLRLINTIADTNDTVITPSFLSLITSVYKESFSSYKANPDSFYTDLHSADDLSPGQKSLIYVLLYTKAFTTEEVESTAAVLALKVKDLFVCCGNVLRGYLKSMFQNGFPGRIKVLTEDRPFMIENVQHVGFRMHVYTNETSPTYTLPGEEYKWKWNIKSINTAYVVLETWDGLKLYGGESTGVEDRRYVSVKENVGEEGQWWIQVVYNGALLVFRNRKYGLLLDSNAMTTHTANTYSNVLLHLSKELDINNLYAQWHIY